MRTTKIKRRRAGAKKLDLSSLKHALRDGRVWNKLAVVIQPEDGSDHYELETVGGVVVDIYIEVETIPNRVPLFCRMSGFAGGAGAGIWTIPAVDDEVIVAVPDGEIDFMPAVIAVLSSRNIPNPTGEGPAVNRTIIINGEVLVHDGTGSTDNLVKKSAYEAHKHPTGVGPSDVPDNALLSTSYTDVLKSK